MSIFVLIMDSDKMKNDNFFFLFNENEISIDDISNKLKEHEQLCKTKGVKYNYVLAIRKLESIGLKQLNAYVKSII